MGAGCRKFESCHSDQSAAAIQIELRQRFFRVQLENRISLIADFQSGTLFSDIFMIDCFVAKKLI